MIAARFDVPVTVQVARVIVFALGLIAALLGVIVLWGAVTGGGAAVFLGAIAIGILAAVYIKSASALGELSSGAASTVLGIAGFEFVIALGIGTGFWPGNRPAAAAMLVILLALAYCLGINRAARRTFAWGTLSYVAQRLLLVLFVLFAVSAAVFWGVHSLPGNAFVSDRVHGASLALLLHQYGLDQPTHVQYFNFIGNVIHYGDFGQSLQIRGVSINSFLLRELSVSAELGGAALLVTLGLGMLFGVLAAIRHNSWVDYVLTTIAVIGYSVPSFVIATVGILVFGLWLQDVTKGAFFYPIQWTPTYGTLAELSLPAISLGFYTSGQVTRITRASMLDVIQQDYVRTAWAKGLKGRVVILRHAFRNALIPVISIGGPLVVSLITGSVIIENIFQIPGLGKEFISSITTHDYNVTVAVSMLYVILIGVANLFVDLLYAIVDPRIRY